MKHYGLILFTLAALAAPMPAARSAGNLTYVPWPLPAGLQNAPGEVVGINTHGVMAGNTMASGQSQAFRYDSAKPTTYERLAGQVGALRSYYATSIDSLGNVSIVAQFASGALQGGIWPAGSPTALLMPTPAGQNSVLFSIDVGFIGFAGFKIGTTQQSDYGELVGGTFINPVTGMSTGVVAETDGKQWTPLSPGNTPPAMASYVTGVDPWGNAAGFNIHGDGTYHATYARLDAASRASFVTTEVPAFGGRNGYFAGAKIGMSVGAFGGAEDATFSDFGSVFDLAKQNLSNLGAGLTVGVSGCFALLQSPGQGTVKLLDTTRQPPATAFTFTGLGAPNLFAFNNAPYPNIPRAAFGADGSVGGRDSQNHPLVLQPQLTPPADVTAVLQTLKPILQEMAPYLQPAPAGGPSFGGFADPYGTIADEIQQAVRLLTPPAGQTSVSSDKFAEAMFHVANFAGGSRTYTSASAGLLFAPSAAELANLQRWAAIADNLQEEFLP